MKSDDDLVEAVEKIKQQPGKDLGVPGGIRTAQTFVRLGLIDEYVLMVHPDRASGKDKGESMMIDDSAHAQAKTPPSQPNPALKPLEGLVGDWEMEISNASFLPRPSDTVRSFFRLRLLYFLAGTLDWCPYE